MNLKNLFDKREVYIIGGGFIGLQEAILFAKKGFDVNIIDINDNIVNIINSKDKNKLHIKEKYVLNNWDLVKDKIKATKDYSVLSDSKIIIIAVNTPLKVYGWRLIEGLEREKNIDYFIDFGPLESAIRNLIKYLDSSVYINSLVTMYPGGTYERIIKPLVESGFELGKDIYITHTPERLNPGDDRITPESIRNLGYKDINSKEVGLQLYRKLLKTNVVPERLDLVELSKLHENAFRLLNIAFAQESLLKYGEKIIKVIELSSTKPIGFLTFYPSPYAGGTCLVKDSIMYWYSTKNELIKKALIINEKMPKIYAKLIYNKLKRKSIKKVLFYGLGFKPKSFYYIKKELNPIERLIKELKKLDNTLDIKKYDPYIKEISSFDKEEKAKKWADIIIYWDYKKLLKI